MGGPVRTQIVWVSAGSKLSGRDRGPVQHAERQERETVVGFGRGPVRGVRSDRPRPPSLHARLISRTGPDPRLAEGGRVREGQGVRPDRGGNSPGWGDDSSNAMGNFCFEVSLSYRRLERLPRVTGGL